MPQAVAAAAVWIGNTIGSAVGATLTAAGVSASVALPVAATVANAAFLVSELAIYSGLQYVVDDIATQKPAPMGATLQLRVAADVPREMYLGIFPTAGSMVARYSRGSNLYNAHFVYQLADHPCVEIQNIYGDGRLIQSTPLAHGVRTEITAYSYSGGARVWMTWHDGRPGQTYDSDLVTKSAQDPDVVSGAIQGWTTQHLGAGCAYVHVEVQYDSDILTSIPEFLFTLKGAKLYDRRKDSTAGGSGSHRLNDPSTWEYSTNAAVALDHYMLGYQVEDDELAFGIGLEPDEVPYAQFAALADLCDEDVDTGTGGGAATMKRYEVNGPISAAQAFEDVLIDFQNQMAARIVDLGGRIGIIGAEEKTPVVSLTDEDWANDEAVRFADKLQFSDLYGAVVGSFQDPGNLYQPTPYERQETDYFQLPDGGEATTAQLDLPLETNPRRAVRLASAWIAREALQPRIVGTFATRSLAWKLEPGDWFEMSSETFGFTDELFEVVDIVKHQDFTVTITARAIDPNFLAFDVNDDPDLSVPPAVDPYSLLLDEPTFDVVASSLTAGGVVEPSIEFTLTSDETIAREIVVEVSKWDGADLVAPSLPFNFHASQIVSQIRAGIQPSTSYKVRAMVRAGLRESPWTAWSSVITTGATYSVGSAASVPWTGVTDPGGTRPDDNADVTSANTAAAIAGQAPAATDTTIQAGATKNTLTFATSAPSSPTNGDIWVDTSTTPTVIKTRVSGAWQNSGSYGGIFGSTLYEAGGGAVASLANFKTILGTAAAITGQGWGATAGQSAADNNYTLVPGANAARFSMLEAGGVVGWAVTNGSFGGTPAVSRKTSGVSSAAKPGLNFDNPAGTNGLNYYGVAGNAFSTSYYMPVKSGERVQVAARILELTGSCSGVLVRAIQFDNAGTTIAELSPTAGLTVPVTVSGAGRVGCLATATQDGFIGLYLYAQKAPATTAGGGFTADEMFISKARAGQVDIDPYTPGPGSEFGADVTLTHTAAAIIGQGWGATASEAAARATRGRGLLNNARFQVPFTNGAVPTSWSDWVNGATDYAARPTGMGDGYCAVRTGVAGANTGIVQGAYVKASTPYVICAEVRRGSGTLTGAGVLVEYFNASFASLGSASLIFATEAATDGGISSSPDYMVRYEKLITTPASCAYVNVYAMDHYTSLGSVASANQIYWSELDLIPLSLVSQLRADITASNTAGAITGQGALATANTVGTSTIDANAVTQNSSAYTAGSTGQTAVGDGWVYEQSVTITTTGKPVLITASALLKGDCDPGGYIYKNIRIRRDTTDLYSSEVLHKADGYTGQFNVPFSATLIDTPAAGTYTYYIQSTSSGSDISVNTVEARALVLVELKR